MNFQDILNVNFKNDFEVDIDDFNVDNFDVDDFGVNDFDVDDLMSMILMSIPLPFHFHCSDPIKAAELAFERAAEAAARAAEQGEIEEEEDTGPKPILPYSSFFILSSTNP